MITTTDKANEKLETMFNALDRIGADVAIHNQENGRVLHPDAAAMFAGIQAGLLTAGYLIKRKKLLECEADSLITMAIRVASQQYLHRCEAGCDSRAAADAAKQEPEGKEDAER